MKTNCHNCGAPIDPRLTKCSYCDTPYTSAMLDAFVTPNERIDVLYADDKVVECIPCVEVGLDNLSEAFSSFGVTCDDAEKALSIFAKAYEKAIER